MNTIYNSEHYCVVEFVPSAGNVASGYEIVDKANRREIYLGGALADGFREHVARLIAEQPSIEEVDDFLSQFDPLMQQPVRLH